MMTAKHKQRHGPVGEFHVRTRPQYRPKQCETDQQSWQRPRQPGEYVDELASQQAGTNDHITDQRIEQRPTRAALIPRINVFFNALKKIGSMKVPIQCRVVQGFSSSKWPNNSIIVPISRVASGRTIITTINTRARPQVTKRQRPRDKLSMIWLRPLTVVKSRLKETAVATKPAQK